MIGVPAVAHLDDVENALAETRDISAMLGDLLLEAKRDTVSVNAQGFAILLGQTEQRCKQALCVLEAVRLTMRAQRTA